MGRMIRLDHAYYLALALWLAATAPAWISMVVDWWNDPNYSHGLLVVPVSLFFLWRGRERWQTVTPTVSGWGLACFFGVSILFLVGTAAAEYFTVRTATFLGVAALTWALLGWPFLRTAWFPFAFLLFAVPWPYVIYYQLTFPLQLFSTKMACAVIDWLGITFVRQGNVIHLPGYSMEVVEACSGVRSLLSLTTLGAAYAYLTQPGYVRPWLLFVLSVPIALAANIMRLVVTASVANGWGPEVAEGFLHELGGVLIFCVALFALMVCGSIISWMGRKQSPASP